MHLHHFTAVKPIMNFIQQTTAILSIRVNLTLSFFDVTERHGDC